MLDTMTGASGGTPTNQPRQWARIRPESHKAYSSAYHGQWFRVAERHDPDLPLMPGYMWLEMAGKVQRVRTAHFEIVERAKRRILVVDDDPSICETLRIALSKTGYDVLQARDGDEAIRLWHQAGPDLVITDVHMPKKSGLLLIQDIQARSPSTPIIAMTDGGPARQLNLMGLAELLGAVRTIAKPFTLEEIVLIVKNELGSK
jgi:CheY-like chemotaxis protein